MRTKKQITAGLANELEINIGDKPKIILPNVGKLISTFAEEVAAIITPTKKLFYRQDAKDIVEISMYKDAEGIEQHSGFKEVTASRFITLAEQFMTPMIEFEVKKVKLQMEKSMGKDLANTVLCSKNLQEQLPLIKRIFTVPLPIMYKGELTFPKIGYDERFQSWTPQDAPIIIEPDMNLDRAKDIIKGIYKEFCFQSKADYIKAIAALLTPFLRGLYPSFKTRTPLFAYVANRERAGKDYCEGITSIVYEGNALEEPPISNEDSFSNGGSSDELRKKILAAFIAGRKRLHFANNKGYINNAVLEAVITADTYSDRLLGKNEILTFDNELDLSLSGNVGIGFTADLANRISFIHFFLDIENANSRQFNNPDLHSWVKQNRGLIISALYALVRNWIKTGSKAGTKPFASFPEWARICGGIMEAAGYESPCEQDKEIIAIGGDSETQDMKTLFELCYEKFPDKWLSKSLIKEIAQQEEGLFSNFDFEDRSDQTKFGQLIIKFTGRMLSDIQMRLKDKNVRASRQEFMFSKDKQQPLDQIFGNLGNDCNDLPSKSIFDKNISTGLQDTKVTKVTNLLTPEEEEYLKNAPEDVKQVFLLAKQEVTQ